MIFASSIKSKLNATQNSSKVLFIVQFTRQNFHLCILCLVHKAQNA